MTIHTEMHLKKCEEIFRRVYVFFYDFCNIIGGRHGRDCIVVGFTTICAISAYYH